MWQVDASKFACSQVSLVCVPLDDNLLNFLCVRIGITTVLSTDHVRSLLRSFDPERQSKVLWASSYHAGENMPDNQVVAGYEAQSQLMLDTLDTMLKGFRDRKESLVIEVTMETQ